jgi:predicted secreted Zn-dependent protease
MRIRDGMTKLGGEVEIAPRRIPLGFVAVIALLVTACATTQTPEQLRVEDAWAACQREGRIPLQVRLTRIETNGRYWISGDAGTYGFQDTQACMSEKFLLPVLTSPIADAVKVKVTNSTQYFSVGGDTASEILASLETNSPRQKKHRRAAGLTSTSQRLAVECHPYTVTIDLDIVVTLPQHDHLDRLPEDLKLRWRRLVASVTAHEQRHVEIFVEGAGVVKRRIEALPLSRACPDIQQQIQSIWTRQAKETNAAQDRFDGDDAERVEMDRTPLRIQIDANQARLTAIESEIRDLERAGESVRRQLETLRTKSDAIVVEMGKANASLAGCPRAPQHPVVRSVSGASRPHRGFQSTGSQVQRNGFPPECARERVRTGARRHQGTGRRIQLDLVTEGSFPNLGRSALDPAP